MEFKTAYSDHLKIETNPGKETRNTYGYKVLKTGEKVLCITGEENIQETINSFYEDSLIENIMARAVAGDNKVFMPNGIFEDTTIIPHSLLDAQRKMTELENTWKTLPLEVRKEYDHSIEKFIADAGSEKWMKLMNMEDIRERSKEDESKHGATLSNDTDDSRTEK